MSIAPRAMTMMEGRDCALQRTAKELARWKDFKSIISSEDSMEYRSACDALLSISCPSWRPHMAEFYDNDGPTLIEVCDPTALRIIDRRLSMFVRLSRKARETWNDLGVLPKDMVLEAARYLESVPAAPRIGGMLWLGGEDEQAKIA
jgi:hypothetical protein